MREIVLDTETTGFEPSEGHRLVEIGCVELENYMPTGRTLQLYINPERDVPAEAVSVHGLDNAFLDDKPVFAEVAGEFMDFINGGRIVAHNAEFDVKFLNHELGKLGYPPFRSKNVLDTLAIARKKFPGSPASLDALCRRFGIDNSNRTLHGALLDSEILAEVYLELIGGRQHGMSLDNNTEENKTTQKSASPQTQTIKKREFLSPRAHQPNEQEIAAHKAMLDQLKNPLWDNRKSSAEKARPKNFN